MPGVDQQESGQQSLSELTHPQLLLGGISDGDSACTGPRSMVLSAHYRTSFTAAAVAAVLPNAACLGPDKIRGSEIENVVLKK